jgi:cell division protein ZapB
VGKIRNHIEKRPLFLDATTDLQHIVRTVDAEFTSLEAKVAQFVSLCERLRAENTELRQQLAAARGDAKLLNERIDTAREKLALLIDRLPD